MRRAAALLALTALSWSQLAGFRCDMGAPTPMLDAASRTLAHAHPAPTGHHHPADDETPPASHGEHHGANGGCLMILAACGAASARPAQTTVLVRLPAVLVQASFVTASVPVAIALGVETPPPRHHA